MAFLEIPVRSDIPSYQFKISLQSVIFTFHFRYNRRMETWIWDLHDSNDNPLISGIPLLSNLLLTYRYRIQGLPEGYFILIDETGQDRDPTETGLGNDFKLLYLEGIEE